MARHQTLHAEKRELKGSSASKRLRKEGIVPAVVYGSSQREYMIQLNSKSFSDVARQQSSENFLVDLEIEGANEKRKLAIVQDIQRDPLTGTLVHVDFRAVSENETVNATIPIRLLGESRGVKNGGLLEHLLHSLEVYCRPNDLPESIDHDISGMRIGHNLKVSELQFPEGVETKMDGEVLVALVTKSRTSLAEEEEEEAAAAAEGSEEAAAEGGEEEASGESEGEG